jgi:Raf kinase inhibitor-like YbhB/YbcL family protein
LSYPDPVCRGFWHWLVVNIPADVTELPLGAGSAGGTLPAAGALDDPDGFRQAGPCPPEGDHPHRYLFTVFAVGDKLDRLQPSFQDPGESRDHGVVQTLNGSRLTAGR